MSLQLLVKSLFFYFLLILFYLNAKKEKDFYRFIQFLKDLLLKEKITEFNFYTDSIPYIEYTKYSLYPIRLRANKNETAIYVVYKNPSFYFKGGKLYQKGKVVAQGDLIAVYDNSSFIFKAR